MAPGMLPMPPSTAAVKAFRPGRKPIEKCTTEYVAPIITPATAASAAPIAKVWAITRLGFTPIRPATRGFSAVARIARPSLVRLTSSISATISAADSTITSSLVSVMVAPPTSKVVVGISSGKVR